MSKILISALALALAGCASVPTSFCDNLPLARLAVDAAIARGDRKPTKQDKADLEALRAAEDLKCAQAASAAR